MLTRSPRACRSGSAASFAETIFLLTQSVPYNFGVLTQLLNEPLEFEDRFSTGSMRNIYSPNVVPRGADVDEIAKKMGKDPVAFRRSSCATG